MPCTRIQLHRQPAGGPPARVVRAGLTRVSRFIATITLSIWLAIEPCQGQLRDIAFGTIRRIETPKGVDRGRIAYDARMKDLHMLLWAQNQSSVYLATLDSTLTSFSTRKFVAPVSFDDVHSADFNNDGKNDLLFVDKTEKLMHLATDLRIETLKSTSTVTLGFEPTDIVVGDLNNDKKKDVILLDPKNPGITPYLGDGRGGFKEGRTIAPDNAISKVVLTHLNNDRIIDMVTYDWVKSELHLLYGVGRGRFLDQTIFPVEGDLKDLLGLEKEKEGYLDLILVMKKPHEIQYWEGDGLGDFQRKSTVAFSEEMLHVAIADVNNDRLQDLVVLSPGALEVHLNSAEDPFRETITYSCSPSSIQLFVMDANRDKRTEALILGKDGGLTIFLNGNQPQVLQDSLEFAAGLKPSAVWVGNANLDQSPDIALVNEKSSTLSFFTGADHGLLGQSSYSLSPHPRYLTHHSKSDTTTRFLISYPESKSISFFSLNLLDNSAVNAVIQSDGESEVLFTNANEKGQTEFFCSNAASSTQDASLSYYLRIGPQTFLERSYRLVSPEALLGVTVSGVHRNSNIDLIYLYRSTENKNLEVGVALLDSALDVKERMVARELVSLNDFKSYLWTADFDGDDTLDLVLAFPKESKNLYLLKGRENDSFGDPELVSADMSLANRQQLTIADVDGDALPDIIVNNQVTGAIGWFKNEGNMSFGPWQFLISSEAEAHFALGDINRDGIADIAVTYPKEGSLKIFSGKLFWKRHGASKSAK